MQHKLIIAKPVQKQIDELPADIQPRVDRKIASLAVIPRPEGARKLKGYMNEYRIRVGNYRICYEIDDSETVIRILRCCHRKDVYRNKD